MATIIRLKKRQAHKLSECATKVYKASKKLMKYIEEEIMEGEDLDEDFDERNGGNMGGGGGRGGSGMGGGNFRDDDDWDEEDEDDDEDMNERRGVPGTGRYGRRRYGRRRRY